MEDAVLLLPPFVQRAHLRANTLLFLHAPPPLQERDDASFDVCIALPAGRLTLVLRPKTRILLPNLVVDIEPEQLLDVQAPRQTRASSWLLPLSSEQGHLVDERVVLPDLRTDSFLAPVHEILGLGMVLRICDRMSATKTASHRCCSRMT